MSSDNPAGQPRAASVSVDKMENSQSPKLTQDSISNPITVDPEKGLAQEVDVDEKKSELDVAEEKDPYLVTWDGPDDPNNPLNWPKWLKWTVTLLVSLGSMITMMSSTMTAPSLPVISRDLHTDDADTQMILSIFVLSYVFGPMVLAPLTEVFGRKPVWILSCCFYILWNTVGGFSNTKGLMIASRFFAGLGGSSQYAIEYPVLADCWRPEQRGHSFAIATFLPLFGPAVGPILGGVLTGSVGWRWVFWVLSIFDAVLMIGAFFFFPETYAGTILHKKAKKLRKETGENYYTEHERGNKSMSRVLAISLARPCRMLLTQPLIQLMSIFLAYNYGILYIVQSTFATLWIERYHQSVTVSGLHYIALALGCILAAQLGARVTDRLWKHLKARAGGEARAEYRVPLMIPGAVILPIGLFWYGWTAEEKTHWILPDIGIAIFAFGIIIGTQAMQAYVMDSFPKYVASAGAASQLPRNITGFAFPLFAPTMYNRLGYGWGNSVLAFAFLAFGIPAPIILWKWGAKLRAVRNPNW